MNPAKLHASLATALGAKAYVGAPLPIIVKVRPGPLARGEARALAKAHPSKTFHLMDAQALVATPEEIQALSEDPAVEMIWPDLPVHTWLDDGVPIIHAPRVWESGFTGRGVKLAVMDTGLDMGHPDFADRLTAFRDFVEPDNTEPTDPNGHGTHVTGIAAGSGAASSGRYRGVAPEASLLIARVLDAGGNGRTSQVMAGIEWAVDQGAQVISISLGGPPFPADGTDALSTLCNAAVNAGVVVCAAAGNMGPAGHTVGAPGAAERVITVGACEADVSQANDQVADFSSRGPTGTGLAKPDVLFPGVGIVAPRAAGSTLGSAVGEQYMSLSGTSQATPFASGTAALLLQANARLKPDEIKTRMLRGAHRLGAGGPNEQGHGRGDAYNTFIAAEGQPLGVDETPTPEPEPPPEEPGGALPQPAGCLSALALACFYGLRGG